MSLMAARSRVSGRSTVTWAAAAQFHPSRCYIIVSEPSLLLVPVSAGLGLKTMPHPRSYQPELHPHLIKGLHHEAKLRGVPMTVLLRSIVAQALEPAEGMRIARQELRRAGDPLVSCRRTDTW